MNCECVCGGVLGVCGCSVGALVLLGGFSVGGGVFWVSWGLPVGLVGSLWVGVCGFPVGGWVGRGVGWGARWGTAGGYFFFHDLIFRVCFCVCHPFVLLF